MNTISTVENNQIVETIGATDAAALAAKVAYETAVKNLCNELVTGAIDNATFSAKKAALDIANAAAVKAERSAIRERYEKEYAITVAEINAICSDAAAAIEYGKAMLADIAAVINQYGISEIAGIKLIAGKVLNATGTGAEVITRSPATPIAEYTSEYTVTFNGASVTFIPAVFKDWQALMSAKLPELCAKHKGASMAFIFKQLTAGKYSKDGYTVTIKETSDKEVMAAKAAAADAKGIGTDIKNSLPGYKDIADATALAL
jgi:hypothetical protein